MSKLLLLFVLYLAGVESKLINNETITYQLQLAMEPISKVISTLEISDPHVAECLEDFRNTAILKLAFNALNALKCVENCKEDLSVVVEKITIEIKSTLEKTIPKMNEYVNDLINCAEDQNCLIDVAREIVGFVVGVLLKILEIVKTGIDEIFLIISDVPNADTCLLEIFVNVMIELQGAVEVLYECIENPQEYKH